MPNSGTYEGLEEPDKSREFILHQDDWPAWPFCPLKTEKGDVAFLHGGDTPLDMEYNPSRSIMMYHGSMYLPKIDGERTEWPNLEALLSAGWRVD